MLRLVADEVYAEGSVELRLGELLAGGDGPDVVHAIDNVDPISGAAVLFRGIVGDHEGRPVVASSVYKQAFSLEDGRCPDEPGEEVEVFGVQVIDGWVRVGLR